MEQTEKHGASMTVAKVAVALLAGLVVVVLLYPANIVDTIPRQCFSMVGLGAPCDDALAVPAGAATAGVVGLSLWLKSRRR